MRASLITATLLFAAGQMMFASTTDELELVTGTNSVTISDNGTGDTDGGADSQITFTDTDFFGWDITVAGGRTHSPGLVPDGIDIFSLSAACTGTCSDLDIFYSDINFTTTVGAGGFVNNFSGTLGGTGTSVTQIAWDDTTNNIFGGQTLIGAPITLTSSNAVGTSTVGGGPAGPGAYSLTLEDVLTAGTDVSYSLDGSITAAPEPTSILLLGGVLLLALGAIRKRVKV